MTKRFQPAKLAAALLITGGLMATPVSLVSAAGGGGGGGGAAPSASGPQYDPAEEYREGVAAYNAGDFDQAASHFKRVTRVARRNGEAHYLLGASYMQAGKPKRARKPLENAVKYSPDRIEAKRDLALAYIQLERMEDAREMLAELNALNANCGGSCADQAVLTQSVAAVEKAMGGEAQASLGPSLKEFADLSANDALYYQAVSAINRDEHEEGLRYLRKAALAFGPHPDILTYQGFANRKLGRFDAAQSYYDRALNVAPNHLGALEYYGELKVERGDISGAKDNLAKLDAICDFGCFEAEELRTWIVKAQS
ncbi:MAG: tetratricopeptide repeat protein [Erythrobacter sp.]|uniref:tetratricopeptide repeat protein n=1 Tax=Erythrobacter sp. TaxID=1042 RepID=UPI003265829A